MIYKKKGTYNTWKEAEEEFLEAKRVYLNNILELVKKWDFEAEREKFNLKSKIIISNKKCIC